MYAHACTGSSAGRASA